MGTLVFLITIKHLCMVENCLHSFSHFAVINWNNEEKVVRKSCNATVICDSTSDISDFVLLRY